MMRQMLTLLVIPLPLAVSPPALAQGVVITAPPPQRERFVVPPGDHRQATRPSDANYYSRTPGVRHDPTFLRPLSRRTETGRAGAAGWTSPASPVGTSQLDREVTGWFAAGVAVQWGGPPMRRLAPGPRAP